MSQKPDSANDRRSVLDLLGTRHGTVSKVLLPDSGSEHGGSPIVSPGGSHTKVKPSGRDKYRIVGEIARGGMGVILKGHDADLGRDVALKVLDHELAKNPAVVSRFVEEAQIGGQLQHPGIVPVYELGVMADESPYFTMKLVKGRTLSALLSQRRSTAENRTRLLQVFESVCQTIAYAHSKGVLHRDIKPANIMVGAFGEVQVVDWGLAKVLHRGGVADERRQKHSVFTIIETVRSGPGSSGSDSIVGSVMGTPAYMSPEQAQGEIEKLDERADVFSLGASLCEILTGRPPYEGSDQEPTLLLASRAKLDPARERITACDADQALKQLCIECMLPARDARPRDAEAVARAVHDYLSSVEERAHKAELAATASSIKANEQRRRFRLALGLAASIVASLLAAAGGWYWVQSERAQRAEQVRSAVDAEFDTSIRAAQAGDAQSALEAARRAQVLAQSGGVDPTLLARATQFVQQAESAAAAAELEHGRIAQDERLRQRLVDLRLEQIPALGSAERESELHGQFVQAFRDYGVDLDGPQITPALEHIRERHVAEEVALALDDIGRLRRRLFGEQSIEFQRTAALAMDLDPHPSRMRLRQAVQADDLPTLLELAAPANLGNLPPGSIWVLSAILWDRHPEHRPDVVRIYDQALGLHPEDFVLQSIGATIFRSVGRVESALACRVAAFGLRPDDPQARYLVAEAMFFAGRMKDALELFRLCAARTPDNAAAHNGVGWGLFQLGDYANAAASMQRAVELENNPQWHSDLLLARCFTGQVGKADVMRAVAITVIPEHQLNLALALADCPDPERRDPQAAIAVVREPGLEPLYAGGGAIIETIARVRLADWQGAYDALLRHDPKTEMLVVTPQCVHFMRALIHWQLGRHDAARECHARGLEAWNLVVGSDDAAWQRSDLRRWRTAAETAMGL